MMDRDNKMHSNAILLQPGTTRFAARLLLLVTLLGTCLAPSPTAAETPPTGASDSKLLAAVDSLATIQQSIETRRGTIRDLREQARKLEDPGERQELEQEIERIRNEIAELQQSFEQVILSGINLAALADQPEQHLQTSRNSISTGAMNSNRSAGHCCPPSRS